MSELTGTTDNKCMVPECTSGQSHRGLCTKHYGNACYLVKTAQTTWEELVANGKCKLAYPRSSKKDTKWMLDFKDRPK